MFLRDEPGCHLALLASLAAGPLADLHIDLFKSNTQVTHANLKANFTLCNYEGYEQKDIVWQAPSIADDGTPEMVGVFPELRPAGDATPNVAYGFILTDDADDLLWWAARFDRPPLAMNDENDAVNVTIRLRLQGKSLVVVVS